MTWAELFFDLVFVFAVTEVSALLADDRSSAGLLRAVIVFVPCYWLWVGTSIQVNQRDISRPSLRLAVFAVALAAIFMALAVPRAYAGLGLLFALAALALLAVGVAALNVVEYARVEQIGWRALLARREHEQAGSGSGPQSP